MHQNTFLRPRYRCFLFSVAAYSGYKYNIKENVNNIKKLNFTHVIKKLVSRSWIASKNYATALVYAPLRAVAAAHIGNNVRHILYCL
jgi:hypothetical protein